MRTLTPRERLALASDPDQAERLISTGGVLCDIDDCPRAAAVPAVSRIQSIGLLAHCHHHAQEREALRIEIRHARVREALRAPLPEPAA